jgi:hypothetical protein
MQATRALVYDLQPIRSASRQAGDVVITFHSGSVACLSSGQPNFGTLLSNVEAGLRRQHAPVGFLVTTGNRLVDLNVAHDTTVRDLCEGAPGLNGVLVGLWAHSPVCFLSRDHPEFERLQATLADAVGTEKMVWVATHTEEVEEGEPDAEGDVPAWPKIMDVRPA